MSAGVAVREDGSDVATFLKSADATMSEAKRRGKNRLFVAETRRPGRIQSSS